MYILGINAYHGDASACLVRDGELVAAMEEERFRRVKYWAGFPRMAIERCLSQAGITPMELDHVGVSRKPNAHLYRKILFALSRRPSVALLKGHLDNVMRVRDIKRVFCEAFHLSPSEFKAQFHHVEHHKAHLASAFLVSPFKDAALLSVDGFGDFVSTMMAQGDDLTIKVLDSVPFPHSLGIFYTAISQYLGFTKYGDEGKVMGLAPYGEPEYRDDFSKILRLNGRGQFELNLDYFRHHSDGVNMTWDDQAPVIGPVYSPKLVEKFGPPREPRSEITPHHERLAASLQATLEEAFFQILNRLHRETGKRCLCLAGGVALNSVANGKIFSQAPFEEVFIQPAAGDAGTALGCAYYIYHCLLKKPRSFVMRHAFTGPSFTPEEIREALRSYGLEFREFEEEELCSVAARLVAQGQVVGWFQGRMEFGPRALGNRSILADPRRPDMKAILNSRIKNREAFRPFAPSILLEAVGDYFEQTYPEPFMLKVYQFKEEKKPLVPAVVHVDGSGRLQTVDQESAPLYWKLIREFERQTGVPVVLNTSFNENEPIVCTPQEAIECFLRTRMDSLIMGPVLLSKEPLRPL